MSLRRKFSRDITYFSSDSIHSPSVIDMWSLRHLLAGCIGYIVFTKYLGLEDKDGFVVFNILHLIYEIKDIYLTYYKKSHDNPKSGWRPRSLINSISDMIFGIIGYLLMVKYYDKISTMGVVGMHVYIAILLFISMYYG